MTTGRPVAWQRDEPSVSWYAFVLDYSAAKWPYARHPATGKAWPYARHPATGKALPSIAVAVFNLWEDGGTPVRAARTAAALSWASAVRAVCLADRVPGSGLR